MLPFLLVSVIFYEYRPTSPVTLGSFSFHFMDNSVFMSYMPTYVTYRDKMWLRLWTATWLRYNEIQRTRSPLCGTWGSSFVVLNSVVRHRLHL